MSDLEHQEYPGNQSCSLCLSCDQFCQNCDQPCDTCDECENCDQSCENCDQPCNTCDECENCDQSCENCDLSCDTSEACEHCDQQNAPPVITSFGASNEISSYWTFEGTVYDADDPVGGMVVQFGGVLAPYGLTATVGSDGTFSVTADLRNLETGTATAQTSDSHGAASNVAMAWIMNDS